MWFLIFCQVVSCSVLAVIFSWRLPICLQKFEGHVINQHLQHRIKEIISIWSAHNNLCSLFIARFTYHVLFNLLKPRRNCENIWHIFYFCLRNQQPATKKIFFLNLNGTWGELVLFLLWRRWQRLVILFRKFYVVRPLYVNKNLILEHS